MQAMMKLSFQGGLLLGPVAILGSRGALAWIEKGVWLRAAIYTWVAFERLTALAWELVLSIGCTAAADSHRTGRMKS